MRTTDFSRAPWRKSSRSAQNAQCVEIGRILGHVGVRDSKQHAGTLLAFPAATWATFVNQLA